MGSRAFVLISLLSLTALVPPVRGMDDGDGFQLQTAPPAERVRSEIPYRDGKVILVSDFQERITKTRYRATGHVEVSYEGTTLTCDEAEFDEETGEGFTKGTTRFSHDQQWLTCSRAEFNFGDQTGTFYDASGFTDQEFLVRGRTIIKTGPDTYRVQSSFVTACQNKRPKWAFIASSSRVRVDHTARMRHMVFEIKGVPVLYFPYMIMPMEKKERSSGFLPFHSGSSTSKGRVFTLGYYQTLGQSADATVWGDYFTLRGLAVGGIFRAKPNPNTRLYLQAYGIHDRLNQGGAHLIVDGETLFDNGFRGVAKVNITSNFLFRQAFSDTFRSATIPQETSVLFLTRNQDSYSTNISFQREEVLFPGRSLVIRRLPSFEFDSLDQQVGNTPLLFSIRTALDGFSRTDTQIQTPQMVQRLDFYPRFSLRLPSFAGFSLIPTAGIRETYYGARTDGQQVPHLVPGSLHRQYFEFGLDLRTPTLERRFSTKWLGDFKHVVEPILTYRRIHGIDHLQETIRFDDNDAIADTNEVEYGLVNRFYRSHETKTGGTEDYEFLSLTLMQKYYFDPTFGGAFRVGDSNMFYPLDTLTGFSQMGTVHNLAPTSMIARVTPLSGISWDVRADYDTKVRRFRDGSVSTFWQQGKIFVAGTYFRTQALEPGTFDANHIQTQVGYGSPKDGFSGSLTMSYNIKTRSLLTSQARLNYMWDCCGLGLEFQQYDLGLRNETRINFSFTLKGIGSFGNIKRPESLF